MSDRNRPLLTLSVKLTAAVEAHRFVTLAGATPAADGDPVIGATRAKGAVNDVVGVTSIGTETVEAAGAIGKGAEVQAKADGKAMVHADGEVVAGIALEAAAADGDKIEVQITARGT